MRTSNLIRSRNGARVHRAAALVVALTLLHAANVSLAGVPPSIVTQPQPQTVSQGADATFEVVATGDEPIGYRWRRNGVFISAATNAPAITLFNVQTSALISVFITNAFGSMTSATVSLTVTSPPAPPQFTLQPTNPIVGYGGPAIFRVAASGSPTPFFRWYHEGVLIGSNSTILSIFNVTAANAGSYLCIASNALGMATSQVAVLTIVSNPPVFTLQPSNQTVFQGNTAQLRATASGSPTPVYRWYRDGAPVEITNGSTFFLFNVTLADAGNYHCVASNASGMATSHVATLTVLAGAPEITSHPTNQTLFFGGSTQFRVTATGNPFPTYQWFHNGTPVGVTNGPLLYVNYATLANEGSYWCVVSNASGVAISQVATLTVLVVPPTVTVTPANQSVHLGTSAYISANVSGHPTPTLRWFHNGVSLGTNASSYLYLFNVAPEDVGSYFCVASNMAGVATSAVATLTILTVPPVVDGLADTNAFAGQTLYWRFGLSNPPATVWLVFEQTNVVLTRQVYFTTDYFTLPNVLPHQSGQYFFVASNQYGVSTSQVATLTVATTPPVFTLSPSNETVIEGTTTFLRFNVSGLPKPETFLYHNGVLTASRAGYSYESGFSVQIFTLPYITMAAAGDYFIVASNMSGMATSAVARITVQRPGPLDAWTIRNPLPQGRDLHGIAWGQNTFVAVGDNGAVVTSTDGTHWTVRNVLTAVEITGIAFGNGRFVATRSDGFALTSTNGEYWDASLIKSNLTASAITFGNGEFLAVGYDYDSSSYVYTAAVYRSTDGLDWTHVPSLSIVSNYFAAVAVGAGGYVVVEARGVAHASADLSSWSNTELRLVPYVRRASYVNGNYVVLGDSGGLAGSTDATTWQLVTNGVHTRNLYGITYGAARYIVVGAKGRIITSTSDLQSWFGVNSPTTDRLDDVIFANNLFVAVGENGTILTSTDGLSWTNKTRGANHDLDGLCVGNGLAIAVGKTGTILTSTDGTTWNYTQAPEGSAGLHGVAYGDGLWVAVGDSTNVFTSTNGLNWEARWSGSTNSYLKSVLHANDIWVAVGEAGEILTSPDALNWTRRTSPVTYDLNEVTYGDGLFVIVGDQGVHPNATVLTSTDGVTWTDLTYYSGKNARGVTFANGTYVMVNNDGLILYAANPASISHSNRWFYSTTGIDYKEHKNLRGVTWGNDFWVAVGNDGIILTSTNLVSSPPIARAWRQRLSPTYENLHAVRYFNNTFIAIGNEGLILQSGPIVPQLLVHCEGEELCVMFSSPHEGVFKLQQTENFTAWDDVAWLTNVVGTVEQRLPLAPGSGKKFYRVTLP